MLQFRFDSVYDKKISEMILIHCVFKKEEKERKAKEAEASAAQVSEKCIFEPLHSQG